VRHVRRFTITLMAVLAALWRPGEAAPQTAGNVGPPRAEIWGAWAVAMPISNGTVDVAYEPPMRLGGTPLESRARQILNVEAGAGYGSDLGVNVFFNRVLGLQSAFTATSANVSGMNGDYATFLRYISSQPPDYPPREYTYEASTPWAPTTGTLGYRSLAIGGVVRWHSATGRAGGTLAGGVDIDWFTGEIESLGYTQFILGGHSTLFSVTHRVLVRPSTGERSFGPFVGGDVHVAIARRVAIMAGVRLQLTSGRARTIQVLDLVDAAESTWVPGLPDAAVALDDQPLELPGTRWRTLVGVKLFVR